MFLNVPKEVDYRAPWLATYDERLTQLSACARKIAYFYEHPDTSTFRYRAYNPGLTLAAHPHLGVSASWFDHRDLAEDTAFIEAADALVICRTRYNAAVARMCAIARARGIPVLFDCDDLVFDIRRVHLLVQSLDQNQSAEAIWDGWFSVIGRLQSTLKLCDGFITTNPFLANRAREVDAGLTLSIMPNYLHPRQQSLSEDIYNAKAGSGWARDEYIHIGYFSGSPSHARDFAVAAPSIAKLMDNNPKIKLRVVGFLDLKSELVRHRDRVEVFPLQDFINLQRLIGEVEINIAPLQENVFTNCKSELKYFEAGICGTVTIASPTFTFKSSIADGETGFLSPACGWDGALRQAVALVESPGDYARIASAAFDYARSRYGWDRAHLAETIIGNIF